MTAKKGIGAINAIIAAKEDTLRKTALLVNRHTEEDRDRDQDHTLTGEDIRADQDRAQEANITEDPNQVQEVHAVVLDLDRNQVQKRDQGLEANPRNQAQKVQEANQRVMISQSITTNLRATRS